MAVYHFKFVVYSDKDQRSTRTLLLILLNLSLIGAVVALLKVTDAMLHCLCLLAVGVLMAGVDLTILSAKDNLTRTTRMTRSLSDEMWRRCHTAKQAFCCADLPTFVAFLSILVYVWHSGIRSLDAFVSGAVAFQLISAKVTLIAIDATAGARKGKQPPTQPAAALGAAAG